jgi:hypothetical protein
MKRIFMSAHFGMLRSFNRRDTYSLRSAYPGYNWAVNAGTASPAACRWLSPLLGLALSCAACGGSPTVLTAFRTEQQAQEHCPEDTILWLDPQSGMYQLKGCGSYGLSGAGRYACRSEAERAGMRAMTN